MSMIEIFVNDRLGRRVRVKCSSEDTIEDLKNLIAAQTGANPRRIQLKRQYIVLRHHPGITLADLEISNGSSLDME